MAGVKYTPFSSSSRYSFQSRIFLVILSFIAFLLIYLLFSRTPHLNPYTTLNNYSNSNLKPETSFVASLETFLTLKQQRFSSIRDDTVRSEASEEDVKRLDSLVYESERKQVLGDLLYPVNLPIKVYVYEMPSKFTYDLLWLFSNTYKDTSNITSNGSPVHRLIEQHSIDYWLWADLIAQQSERLLKTIVRVHCQEEADLYYIPFFTTISFFLLEKQQCKALYRVKH